MLNKLFTHYFIKSVLKGPVFGRVSTSCVQVLRNMSSSSLENVPKVDIDPSGVFKYILCKVHDKDKEVESSIHIVRGYARCNYHSDIYDLVQEVLSPLDVEPLGGGRISIDPDEKSILIYGYSQGYGKADHEITAEVIKKKYSDYKVSISNEGY